MHLDLENVLDLVEKSKKIVDLVLSNQIIIHFVTNNDVFKSIIKDIKLPNDLLDFDILSNIVEEIITYIKKFTKSCYTYE